ncbi:Cysteine-rich_membrane protein 2 [Hexamita inflata]|uniref:Cysteine-rich membrane protein 2 n=1 Tax=Hexamita inflata TaxID=28002 RepID=A0AA86Q9C7_9EUKA|nr:Cysteine-rich membrane protein 2 [Hexamita inflata]
MMIMLLTILSEETSQGPLCGRGFLLLNGKCECNNLLSVDQISCVQKCEETEYEVNKRCLLLKSKQASDDCEETFGIGFKLIGDECTCQTECYCGTEKCCQSKGKHFINNQCDDCPTAFGTGYTWNDQKKTCTCSGECVCTSQLCCAASGLIFLDGKCAKCSIIYNTESVIKMDGFNKCQCDPNYQDGQLVKATDICAFTICEIETPTCRSCGQFGTGYIWDSNKMKCVCPNGVKCSCTSKNCCAAKFGIQYIVDKCSTCELFFGEGAIWDVNSKDKSQDECVCDSSKKYIGGLVSKYSDPCKKCDEVYTKYVGCQTCQDGYGTGYTYNKNTEQCECQGNNLCICTSLECCEKYNMQFDASTQLCSINCNDFKNYKLKNGICSCDESKNYYQADLLDTDCTLCQGVFDTDKSICTTCENFGTGYTYDPTLQKCICLSGNCQCTSEFCCQLNSTHFINNKCIGCLQAYGPGYSWDKLNMKCLCQQEPLCKCKTALCCNEHNMIFQNGKCVDCATYGTNYQTKLSTNECSCIQGKTCICTSESCCNDKQQTYQSGTCKECSVAHDGSEFKNGKCECDLSKKYVGELVSEYSVCQQCLELIVDGKCQTCAKVHGNGAIYKSGTCVCNIAKWFVGDIQTGKCQECPEGVNLQGTACTTCAQIYGSGAVISGGNTLKHCICNYLERYVGELVDASSSCTRCPELMVREIDHYVCKLCINKGLGFIYDEHIETCKCDSDNKYIASENTCVQCSELLIDGKCMTCEQKYGYNAIFENGICTCNAHSIGSPYSLSKCTYCDEVADKIHNQCKFCSDIHGQGVIYNNGKCQCDQMNYIGTLKSESDKCVKCPILVKNGKCAECSDFIENTVYNPTLQKCDCAAGYERQNLIFCVKTANKTTGLIVGIVIGGVVVLIVASVFVVKCKKQKKMKDETFNRGIATQMRPNGDNPLPEMLEIVQ